MSDDGKGLEDVEPMKPLDREYEGAAPAAADEDVDGVGVGPDPVDPLKRAGKDDMPGLDPVVDVLPHD